MLKNLPFSKKIVFITGAASGIGSATLDCFLEAGASIVAVDINRVDLSRREIFSDKILEFNYDVSDKKGWNNAIQKTINEFGSIDVLVNCAGVNFPNLDKSRNQDIFEVSIEDIRKILSINLESMIIGSQVAMSNLIKSKGVIVNISSVAALVGVPNAISYGLSKAAISQASKSIALKVVNKGVRVNVVHPGRIKTPMYTPMTKENGYSVPMGRLGLPREVAEAVFFLASEDASYITGSSIIVDGGLTL